MAVEHLEPVSWDLAILSTRLEWVLGLGVVTCNLSRDPICPSYLVGVGEQRSGRKQQVHGKVGPASASCSRPVLWGRVFAADNTSESSPGVHFGMGRSQPLDPGYRDHNQAVHKTDSFLAYWNR